MIKPINPITKIPIADIFAMFLNSSEPGFFRTCQTLLDWIMNDFILVVVPGFSIPTLTELGLGV